MRLFCAPSDPTTLYLTRYAMAWRMRPTSTAFEEAAAMAAAATATAVTLRCCCVSPGDTPRQLEPGTDMSIHLCALQIRTLPRSHDGHLIKASDPQCKVINELMSPLRNDQSHVGSIGWFVGNWGKRPHKVDMRTHMDMVPTGLARMSKTKASDWGWGAPGLASATAACGLAASYSFSSVVQ